MEDVHRDRGGPTQNFCERKSRMRPVTKGNPTTYNQNANATAIVRRNELQSYIDIIPQSAQAEANFLSVLWQEGVNSQLEYTHATGNPYVAMQFARPANLLATIVRLRAAFAQGLRDKVSQDVLLNL